MAFKTRKKEEFSYSSPQEMYQDNKFKKIMGSLDYQAAMQGVQVEGFTEKEHGMVRLENVGDVLFQTLLWDSIKVNEQILYTDFCSILIL